MDHRILFLDCKALFIDYRAILVKLTSLRLRLAMGFSFACSLRSDSRKCASEVCVFECIMMIILCVWACGCACVRVCVRERERGRESRRVDVSPSPSSLLSLSSDRNECARDVCVYESAHDDCSCASACAKFEYV